MSCRHDLANGTCTRCYPVQPAHIDASRRCTPDAENTYMPNLEGPGAVPFKTSGDFSLCKVAALVLRAFVGPCPRKHESCHYPDSNPRNNHVDNLRWATHQENIDDKVRAGTQAHSVRHGMVKLTVAQVHQVRRLRTTGMTFAALATKFNVSIFCVYAICKGLTWRHLPNRESA